MTSPDDRGRTSEDRRRTPRTVTPGRPQVRGGGPGGPTGDGGLTAQEAERRLARHGPNVLPRAPSVPLRHRIGSQLRDPLIMVLLAAVVLTAVVRDLADMAVILLVVVANTAVGVAQEVRADRAIAALTELSAPAARVVRDGVRREVPAAVVVPGDRVLLGEGDVVPADAELATATGLLVDESSVTGESAPAEKTPAGGGSGRVGAGTVVVHGSATADVTATGADSSLGRVAALMRPGRGRTPLQDRLAGLGRVLALTAVVLCLAVFVLGLLRGQSPQVIGVTAIGLAVAAVPESLPAVVTLSLALGAGRMAARHAVVRRLPAVETLGSVTVLATDKTGTLTEGAMVAVRVWTPHTGAVLTGRGYDPAGTLRSARGGTPAGRDLAEITALLRTAALCNDAALAPPREPGGPWGAVGDPTEAALVAAAVKAGIDTSALHERAPRIAEVPFDSGRRRMTTAHRLPGGRTEVCLKGAPEVVLDPAVTDAPADLRTAARQAADRMAEQGLRVLAVADGERTGIPSAPEAMESGLSLRGLVAVEDPPKESAASTLEDCRAAGMTPVLITGDHPATAAAIAGRLGIVRGGADAVVTGDEAAAMSGSALRRARVFARTDPEQKLGIIRRWREAGQVTAMTGDGVNDGPALRQADIGVAMGRRGTEVARQAADLVLADDELRTVVAAVEEGRRIYDNIRKFLLYGLAGGAAEIAVMLAGPLFGLALPLLAGQILWINLLTHGLTGVALGAEPAAPGIMRRAPRSPREHVLGDGLWTRVLLAAGVITAFSLAAGLTVRGTGGAWQSALFLTLLTAQLGVCAGQRQRLLDRANGWLPAAIAVSLALGLAALYVPLLRDLLHTAPLTGWELLPAAGAGLLGLVLGRLVRPGAAGGRAHG